MQNRTLNHIKLGLFVLAGLSFLIVMLYLTGKNRNLFSPAFEIKTRFQNIQGLQPGNNVRYSGIQAGSVKRIDILNDTLIEVTLTIDVKFKNIIKQNALVSIGNDGFVGNKVVNISPVKTNAPLVVHQTLLASREVIDTDQALRTLDQTNMDIAVITNELKHLLLNINKDPALLRMITSDQIPNQIKQILAEIHRASQQLHHSTSAVSQIIDSIQDGRGSIGALLQDSILYANLVHTSGQIKAAGEEARKITGQVSKMVQSLDDQIRNGRGPVQAALNDTTMVTQLQSTLDHIEKGAASFNLNMEALKSNFLFRGYFKKMEKKEKRDSSIN